MATFCYSNVKLLLSDAKFSISEIAQFIYCTIMQNVLNLMQYFVSFMCWENLGKGFISH